jgi:hypothetical protein
VPLSTLDLARERAATLSPAGVQVSKEDRYRSRSVATSWPRWANGR